MSQFYLTGICLHKNKKIVSQGSKPVAGDNLVTHILPEVIKQ